MNLSQVLTGVSLKVGRQQSNAAWKTSVTAVFLASKQAPVLGFRLTAPFPGTVAYSIGSANGKVIEVLILIHTD